MAVVDTHNAKLGDVPLGGIIRSYRTARLCWLVREDDDPNRRRLTSLFHNRTATLPLAASVYAAAAPCEVCGHVVPWGHRNKCGACKLEETWNGMSAECPCNYSWRR